MITEFFHRFPSPVVFQVSGKDSERYLQARLTNDLKRLAERKSLLAACLNPQGKTKALFRVYRRSAQEFLVFALAGNAEQIKQDLCCFIVADRVEVKDISSECFVTALSESVTYEQITDSIYISDPYLKLNLLLSNHDPLKYLANYPELDPDGFKLYRLQQALPEFPEEVRVDSLFPESGITGAISNTKGCYAGQEVVERVIALGKLPAKILTFHTTTDTKDLGVSDCNLLDESGNKFGEILSALYDSVTKSYFCFARVPSKFTGQLPTLVTSDSKKFYLSLVTAG